MKMNDERQLAGGFVLRFSDFCKTNVSNKRCSFFHIFPQNNTAFKLRKHHTQAYSDEQPHVEKNVRMQRAAESDLR